jgi:para-nitrobenzyl esterase
MRRLHAAAPGGPPSGEDVGRAFAEKNGITGDDSAALAALRALPAAKLVNGMNLMNQQPDTYAGPMVDGRIVPDEVEPLFRAGKQARVPYLIGANALEFGFFALPADRTKESFAAFGPDTDAATAAYAASGDPGVSQMSDQAMVEPARLLARLTAAAGPPTWQYRFSYVATSLRDTARGALHATEIPFVFDTVRAKYEAATSAQDEAMGAAMNAYWVAFARTGDPNGAGRPRWPAYTAAGDAVMDFALTGPAAGPDPWKARLDLVEKLADRPRP